MAVAGQLYFTFFPVYFQVSSLEGSQLLHLFTKTCDYVLCKKYPLDGQTPASKAVPLHATKAFRGERRYSSYSFTTSALDGNKLSASRPDRALPRGRTHGTHCTGGWVGPRAGLDTEDRGKILWSCRGSNPDHPVVQSVVRRYTDWATPAPQTPDLQLLIRPGAAAPAGWRLHCELLQPAFWFAPLDCLSSVSLLASRTANDVQSNINKTILLPTFSRYF
jgi:hypothetical protein